MPENDNPFGDRDQGLGPGPDDPALNPEHIANIPAGVKRAEERARRADRLAQQAEEAAESAGSIPNDALRRKEPEILRHFAPDTGDVPITNARPDRHYVWVHASKDDFQTSTRYQRMGYLPVVDPDKECWEFRGQHCAGYVTSTARGLGDATLWWCPIEVWKRNEAQHRHLADAMNAVEEGWEDETNDQMARVRGGGMAVAHGRRDDPHLRQTIFRGTAGQIERLGQQLRTGTVDRSWARRSEE